MTIHFDGIHLLSSIVVAVLVVAVVFALVKKVQKWPYYAVPVMSNLEKKFYYQLVKAFPHYHILAQVQLSRVIRPPKNRHEYKWLNKIWRMSLDYVILDSHLDTLVVIELDDRSHLTQKRKEADERKNKALKAAGLRLIRIKTNSIPTLDELKYLVNRG
ncbi:hypothetical protein DKL61_03740 [Gammaproteobacteria bacterium ESL0073]|nr:hypothetical protein DKL61_03740 [Gammaproteobacteria bacterium ESL0073]